MGEHTLVLSKNNFISVSAFAYISTDIFNIHSFVLSSCLISWVYVFYRPLIYRSRSHFLVVILILHVRKTFPCYRIQNALSQNHKILFYSRDFALMHPVFHTLYSISQITRRSSGSNRSLSICPHIVQIVIKVYKRSTSLSALTTFRSFIPQEEVLIVGLFMRKGLRTTINFCPELQSEVGHYFHRH